SVAILAGGTGSRLRPVVSDRPKPLALVHDRPYLTFLLDHLADFTHEVVLLTGYQADQLKQVMGETYGEMRLIHSPEPFPLGTGGAIRKALPRLSTPVILLMNGDSFCDVDLAAFWNFHRRSIADMSLVLARVDDTSRYGKVALADDGRVLQFGEKEQSRAP